MSFCRIVTCSVVGTLLWTSNDVQGGPITTFEFSGYITNITDPTNLLNGQVQVGAPFQGSFSVDTSTADDDPSDGGRGIYLDAISLVQGHVGLLGFFGPSTSSGIDIRNGGVLDILKYTSDIGFVNQQMDLLFYFSDTSGSALDSDEIPLAFDLSSFTTAEFTIADTSETVPLAVQSQVTAIVPEPTTLCLLVGLSLNMISGRKMRKVILGLACAAVSSIMVSSTANAGPITTFEFSGYITNIVDRNNLLGGEVVVGSPFEGQFTIDLSTPDENPFDGGEGIYLNAVTFLRGQVGDFAYFGPQLTSDAEITNGSLLDIIRYHAEIDFLNESMDFRISLIDNTGAAILTDAIPTNPPDLDLFSSATFHIGDQTETVPLGLTGQIVTLIPEPGTLLLLGLGAAVVSRRAGPRRRSRIAQGCEKGRVAQVLLYRTWGHEFEIIPLP